MTNFFHKLFNPHCPHCALELECQTCDVLREQLSIVMQQNRDLLNRLLPVEPIPLEKEEIQPLKPRNISWDARRRILEAEDREAAKVRNKLTMEDLEKEVIHGS